MPDWFWANGRVHAIRSSPGYDEALVGLGEKDKEYLRGGTSSYTVTSPRAERTERIEQHAKTKASGKVKYTYPLASSVQEQRFVKKHKRKEFY